MRKICINADLKDTAQKYPQKLFSTRKTGFTQPVTRLQELYNKIPKSKINYRKYVLKIITEYPEILSATPNRMRELISEFENFKVDVNKKIPNKKQEFYKSIVYAMKYDDLREAESIPYLKNSGIKTCVYCNSQFAIVVENRYYDPKKRKKVKSRRALLELDHFYPKSRYPFLCTSFFNLYPVCSNCNKAKGNKKIGFELYTENQNEVLNTFSFWIDDDSIVKYKTSKKCNDLKFSFKTIDSNIDLHSVHNETFCIEGIYNTQKDLAEEILIKSEIYTNAYKRSLLSSFKTVIYDETMINRLILGNYDKDEDIHKRPLAKFTQDIAKQLGLI